MIYAACMAVWPTFTLQMQACLYKQFTTHAVHMGTAAAAATKHTCFWHSICLEAGHFVQPRGAVVLASSGASRPIAAAKLVMMGEPLPNTLATTPITPAAPASFASTT